MALYDAAGTSVGTAAVSGTAGVITAISEAVVGGSSAGAPPNVIHDVVDPIVGSALVSASSQGVFNVSGFAVGSGDLLDARLMDAAGIAVGSSLISGEASRVLGASGYVNGGSLLALSWPEPMIGAAIVTAFVEVIHVLPPLCQQPMVTLAFRWGHTFTRGDLVFRTLDARGNPFGPVCISYTLYQMQRGCALKQIGPAGRTPASDGLGSYYVTGIAGECGQPGLWAVRWRYQRTFSDPVVEKDCYFQVVDSVSRPIPGDTLERHCKYGWD